MNNIGITEIQKNHFEEWFCNYWIINLINLVHSSL